MLSGAGQVKLDDELHDIGPWDIVRVAPATFRGFAAGADGLELLAIGSDRPEGGDGVQSDDDWWGEPEAERLTTGGDRREHAWHTIPAECSAARIA